MHLSTLSRTVTIADYSHDSQLAYHLAVYQENIDHTSPFERIKTLNFRELFRLFEHTLPIGHRHMCNESTCQDNARPNAALDSERANLFGETSWVLFLA